MKTMLDRQTEHELTGYPSIDKPWLKYYSEDKRNFDIPECSVYEYLKGANKDNQDSIALEYFGKKISYKDLISKVDKCAKAFVSIGVKSGDVVSFCNPTTPEVYYAFFALNKIGAIANMIDPRTNASRIREFIKNTDSKIVFYLDIIYPKLESILSETCVEKAICISVKDSMGALVKTGYSISSLLKNSVNTSIGGKYLNWKDFYKYGDNSAEDRGYTQKESVLDLPAGIVYTSGTTGVPKGAVISNRNLISIVLQEICTENGWDRKDKFLGIMPPFIAYGLVIGFVLPLCMGMRVIIIPKFEVEKFDWYIKRYRPNHILGVPAYIEHLMYSKLLRYVSLDFFKTVIVGGDKMNPETEVEVNAFLASHHSNCRVIKGYGMTEMSSCAVYPRNNESNKIGSVGTPCINNNTKIVCPESGEELGYNQIGEICLTGPTLILGYWKNEDENKKVFKIENGTRWIHTGDRGYVDEDGCVFFSDRVKRIIVRSDGHNVWPSDSERIIERHPSIKSCCVVGTKDTQSKHGKIVTAFVVLRDGIDKSSNDVIEELKTELLSDLPIRDVPERFFIIDELPLSSVGKIDYQALEESC